MTYTIKTIQDLDDNKSVIGFQVDSTKLDTNGVIFDTYEQAKTFAMTIKDKMNKDQWLENMVHSVRVKLDHAMIDLGMNYADAKKYVQQKTTAGYNVWAIIDEEAKNVK